MPIPYRFGTASGTRTLDPLIKSQLLYQLSESCICVGAYLSSRTVAHRVLSTQVSLTTVFGMGTGGPSPLSAPTV